jgi:MFS transporter, DHA1 family, multidrug resistance protein
MNHRTRRPGATAAPVDEPAPDTSARAPVVLVLLAGLVALGPLSTDAYVPGLPMLAADLGATPSLAQLTVTTCLIGLAVGQLVAGPLSDVLGRRRPVLAGLAVYTGAGLAAAAAPTIGVLVALRGVQGLGGSFCLVIAYACVRDRFSGAAAARYFSLLLLVTGLAPILAPLAGAQIIGLAGWAAVFVALAAFSGLLLVACTVALPETLPPSRRRSGVLSAVGASYLRVLSDRAAVGYTAVNAVVFAAMFAYISGSPFVLQDGYGLSPQQYGLVFAVNALGLVAAAQLSGRLVGRLGARTLLTGGAVGASAAGVASILVVVAQLGLWPLLACFFVLVTCVGFVLPNAAALTLEGHGTNAGAASAVLGSTQFLVGGLAAPLVGAGSAGAALPTAAVLGGAGLITPLLLGWLTVVHRQGR